VSAQSSEGILSSSQIRADVDADAQGLDDLQQAGGRRRYAQQRNA